MSDAFALALHTARPTLNHWNFPQASSVTPEMHVQMPHPVPVMVPMVAPPTPPRTNSTSSTQSFEFSSPEIPRTSATVPEHNSQQRPNHSTRTLQRRAGRVSGLRSSMTASGNGAFNQQRAALIHAMMQQAAQSVATRTSQGTQAVNTQQQRSSQIPRTPSRRQPAPSATTPQTPRTAPPITGSGTVNPSVHPQFRSKAVNILHCRHCSRLMCRRAMKAILLGNTKVELYSTDTPPVGVQLVYSDYLTQNCLCRIRDAACLGCGNVVGYHVTQPCERCLEACNNGHFFMFLSEGVQPLERYDASGTKLLRWASLPRADDDVEETLQDEYDSLCR